MSDDREPARQLYWRDRNPSSYRCPGCGRGRDQVSAFHVHHLDGDKQNHDESNLVALCPTCHLGDEHDLDVDDPSLQPPQPRSLDPPQPRSLTPERGP